MKKKLLEVTNLKVAFSIQEMELEAVRGISFDVYAGEAVGIVGESGCGKSTAVQALAGLTSASRIQGTVLFNGQSLLDKKNKVLGNHIGMVFQDPMASLNPTMKIGSQIAEGMIYHKIASRSDARKKSLELLHLVGVSEPEAKLDQYPHQLSGGQRQRVLIAIALSCNPQLLIADEPTTALDVTIQAQILRLLKEMQKHFHTSLLLITHDFGVVANLCDRILVFYAGKIVEQGAVHEVLEHPRHPYTQMLLESIPRLDRPRSEALRVIEGAPPDLFDRPKGCAFAARCPYAFSSCEKDPPFFGSSACWRQS